MSALPPERKLLASYKLWRRHVDPDGLVSASEFAEMDDDDKREAMREIGGAEPAPAQEGDDGDDEEAAALGLPGADDEEDEEGGDEDDDPEAGRFVELTEDVVDPRSSDPFA